MKTFWFDLKALLGLILPVQYCHVVVRRIEAGFLGDVLSWAMLIVPTIQLYDM